MRRTFNRRTLFALTAGAALGAGTFGRTMAYAQDGTSPHTFASGQTLTWIDPWTMDVSGTADTILPNSVLLNGGDSGEVLIGYNDAPQDINSVAESILLTVIDDISMAQIIAGGGGKSVGADGAGETSSSYLVYRVNLEDKSWGIYIELINEVQVGLLSAPVDIFESKMSSAQASVQIDGVGVFAGIDGAELQRSLEDTPVASEAVGEFTDSTGLLHVTWTNGWTELARNDEGVELTNPDNSIILYTAGYPTEGLSWQELTDMDVDFLYADQGADATLTGPFVTDTGFSFATDGEYSIRVAQGLPTESPDLYLLVFAANFAADIDPADAVALIQEAQAAVSINGTPALQGLETLIEE